MKKLIFRIVFPLTFFSYMLIEKWWYVYIIEGPDKTVYGFPLINCSQSLASSMELYYYVLETIFNVFAFALFWFVVIFIIQKYIFRISVSNVLAKISTGLLVLYLLAFAWFSSEFNSRFFLKRDFDIKAIDKGYNFIWSPHYIDYDKYDLKNVK